MDREERTVMTDLRTPVTNRNIESVAHYFQVAKNVIEFAIKRGAKTYADVYRFIKLGEM